MKNKIKYKIHKFINLFTDTVMFRESRMDAIKSLMNSSSGELPVHEAIYLYLKRGERKVFYSTLSATLGFVCIALFVYMYFHHQVEIPTIKKIK